LWIREALAARKLTTVPGDRVPHTSHVIEIMGLKLSVPAVNPLGFHQGVYSRLRQITRKDSAESRLDAATLVELIRWVDYWFLCGTTIKT
jgi:hypothetical protein